jgi:hypothetical protein
MLILKRMTPEVVSGRPWVADAYQAISTERCADVKQAIGGREIRAARPLARKPSPFDEASVTR